MNRRVIWTAASDGIGHAARSERSPRTLCGQVALPPRYGYPVRQACTACDALAKQTA